MIYATTVDGDVFTPSWVSENVPRIMGYEVVEALEPTWWYEDNVPERVAAVDAGGHEALDPAVHSFKSAAGLIGVRELVRLLGQLEAIARSGAFDGAGEVRDRVVQESGRCSAPWRSLAESRRDDNCPAVRLPSPACLPRPPRASF